MQIKITSKTIFYLTGSFLLVVLVLGIYVPLMPIMPVRVDGERYAANEALYLGLQFGKDFIFTSGPYSSVYTKMYHPYSDALMVFSSTIIALATWISVLIIAKSTKLINFVFFVLCFFILPAPGDSYLLFAPLLISLACLKLDSNTVKSPQNILILVFICIPLGLLPLVKGTFLILSMACLVICVINSLLKKNFIAAAIILFTPMISVIAFWLMAGQNFFNLPIYLKSIFEISAPYSEAMSIDLGGSLDMPFILALALGVLVVIGLNRKRFTSQHSVFLFIIYFIYLFISFKAGFVRHDLGHVRISFGCILFATLCIPMLIPGRGAFLSSLVLVVVNCVWILTIGAYTKNGFDYLQDLKKSYINQVSGLKHRVINDNFLKNEFNKSNEKLRLEYAVPTLSGTTDIYSFNQPYLIASNNQWSTRPIIHSYSSYSKNLIRKNNEHLLGINAPDNIIFSIQPMDYRLPALEDGLSWFTLLQHYSFDKRGGEYLYLKRNENLKTWEFSKISTEIHNFGDLILVPQDQPGLLVAKIKFTKSIFGNISTVLYKPSQIKIILNCDGGVSREFRLIATMSETEFLLSPLVENTKDFELLYEAKNFYGTLKQVQSIQIETTSLGLNQWSNAFEVTFLTMESR